MTSLGAVGAVFAVGLLAGICGLAVDDARLAAVARVELPSVAGRIDHLAWDAKHRRLAVAALGNGSVEIVEWKGGGSTGEPLAGRVVARLEQLEEPQGIVFLAERDELLFTTGGDGLLHVVDAATLAEKKRIAVGGDADNVRFDAKAGLAWVGIEEGIAVVDVAKQERVAVVKLAGHAESLQLEPDGSRLFVNVPSARQVAVVDRAQRTVIATWPIAAAARNYPMALDPAAQCVLIGCREPARLLSLDLASGAVQQELAIGGDCDDLFVDVARGRVDVVCGEGVVTTLTRAATGELTSVGSVATAPGARTGLLVPELALLFVAVPARDGKPAAILAYATR